MSTGRTITCAACGAITRHKAARLCNACYVASRAGLMGRRQIRLLVSAMGAPEIVARLDVTAADLERWHEAGGVPDDVRERAWRLLVQLRRVRARRERGRPAPLYEDYEPVTLERLLERTMEG